MIVAAFLMVLAVVNGQDCTTKFGNPKRSKLRRLCREDDACKWTNDSGPKSGKKDGICVNVEVSEGVKDCSKINSQVNCPKSIECEWRDIDGVSQCRNVCSRLSGDSFQRKKKKMCRKDFNSHCRWRKDENVCYDVKEAPEECNDILKVTQCRENETCEWIKVQGNKRGCRKIVVESRCQDILDRQQCRMFVNNGQICQWQTFPIVQCVTDDKANCESIIEEEKCGEANDRYGFTCFWNGRGEGVYEDNGLMNSKAGLPIARCNNFPSCESMTGQGACESNKNMVGGSCYWNPTYKGGPNKDQSTAPYRCKEAKCSTLTDKYTCKHFGCYWARKFGGWEKNKDNDKADKKPLKTYVCQDP